MGLREDIPTLLKHIEAKRALLEHNAVLFDIWEGQLLPYVLDDLRRQLSPHYFDQVKHRAIPVNILQRIINKLSTIYTEPPKRSLPDNATATDKSLFDAYGKELSIDSAMQTATELFNLFKNTFIEPYVTEGEPNIRAVPSDRFCVYGSDPSDPLRVTHYVKFMGKRTRYTETKNSRGEMTKSESQCQVYYAYTDTEFLPFDEQGDVLTDILMALNNEEGINPYGRIPGVYVNRSKHELVPRPDTDLLALTKALPVLLSDLSAGIMFQCFTVMYGVDVKSEGLKMSPNAFWSFQSDKTSAKEPKIGTLKPEIDSDKALAFIKTVLQLWLQSKSIKPGAIGDVSIDNAASGIAKAIDEMDTSEDRKKQVAYFQSAERELWDFIMGPFHEFESTDPEYILKGSFNPALEPTIQFPEQQPLTDRSQRIDDEIKQIDAGLQTKRGAIQAINPDLSPKEVEEKFLEIEKEQTVEIVQPPQDIPPPNQPTVQ